MITRLTIIAGMVLSQAVVFAQNIGINSTGANPNNSAMLDIVSTNRGLLMPRVALTATNAAGPIAAPATSLMVYNTASAGAGATAVTPGFYYWDGAAWQRFDVGNNVGDWKILGNANTTAGTNFLGTTNAQGLDFRTNNNIRFRIPNADQVHAMATGTEALPFYSWDADPNTGMYSNAADELNFSAGGVEFISLVEGATDVLVVNEDSDNAFDVRMEGSTDANLFFLDGSTNRVGIGLNGPTTKFEVSSGAADAIYGHGTSVGAYVGYETNFTFGVAPQTIQGSGLWAANPSAGYTSIYAQSTGTANVAASINYSSVWIPNYNLADNAGTGTQMAVYGQINVSNNGNNNSQRGVLGLSQYTAGGGNPGFSVGVAGVALGNSQDSYGMEMIATSNGEGAVGGYFEGIGGGGGYIVTVADDFQNRKIIGTGTVSEVIPTKDHGRITLTCPESPEYWYQDYYTVEMVNGKAHLDLDPILVDIIIVDQNNPIRVFATPQNMLYFNGVTTLNQTSSGVDLVELNGGTNSGTLQIQVVVKPKTNYGEGRFQQASGPSWTKNMDIPGSEAKNRVYIENPEKVFEWPADWDVYNYSDAAKKHYENLKSIKATKPGK